MEDEDEDQENDLEDQMKPLSFCQVQTKDNRYRVQVPVESGTTALLVKIMACTTPHFGIDYPEDYYLDQVDPPAYLGSAWRDDDIVPVKPPHTFTLVPRKGLKDSEIKWKNPFDAFISKNAKESAFTFTTAPPTKIKKG